MFRTAGLEETLFRTLCVIILGSQNLSSGPSILKIVLENLYRIFGVFCEIFKIAIKRGQIGETFYTNRRNLLSLEMGEEMRREMIGREEERGEEE